MHEGLLAILSMRVERLEKLVDTQSKQIDAVTNLCKTLNELHKLNIERIKLLEEERES